MIQNIKVFLVFFKLQTNLELEYMEVATDPYERRHTACVTCACTAQTF